MKTKETKKKITTNLADLCGNSMVHENVVLACDISFDPLLTKTSSQSLKCIDGNWSMYSLLKLTLVQ